MLDFFKKKKGHIIGSPVNGQAIDITEVPDETFSTKVLGEGFAVIPEDGNICAPVDGKVSMIFETKHALTMVTEWGAEILLHIGLETVSLNGEPFTVCVESDQEVKKGQILVKADFDAVKQAGLNTMVITVLCNSADYGSVKTDRTGKVSAGDEVVIVSA